MIRKAFTKQAAERTAKAVEEFYHAIPVYRRTAYIDRLDDILLFIEMAKYVAPNEKGVEVPVKSLRVVIEG